MEIPSLSLFLDILIGGVISGGAIYSLIAAGLNLQYGVTRILNVAYGEFLMVGAYITLFSFMSFGINPLVSLAISGPIVFIAGILIQMGVFRKLVRESKSGEELEFRSLLACFALLFIIQNIALAQWGATPKGYTPPPPLNASIPIYGTSFQLSMITVALASMVINLVLYLFLRFTQVGAAMRATVEEPVGAQLIGVNIFKIHALSFGLGVLLSAWAGTLLSMLYAITPTMGLSYTIIALIVIILGGIGSFTGSVLGGFMLGYVSYITMRVIESALLLVVLYAFLIVILLIRPKGLFGR